MRIYMYFLVLSCLIAATGYGQSKASQLIPLEDLSAFKSQAGNWQIVGDVTMNPSVDVHHKPVEPTTSESKKKKKSKADEPIELPQAVTFTAGKGILLNMNDETKKDQLITNWEHGDIELEFEVMLPKGSNSGVYLQGRYEVQLLDSWGVKNPKYSDIGGIYRNWENEPGKIYMGKAPLSNPSKAPGLWQKMKISFRAPKFDSNGKKIANARFVSVELNGVKIHDNVEVPLPTGGPIENNEKPTGPIMIQGDHGPVAFRNIRYTLMKDLDFNLKNITFKTYYGNFKTVSDYTALKPAATGSTDELTVEILEKENAYGSTYNGTISIPEKGEYEFTLVYTGGLLFTLDNKEVVNLQRADAWETSKAMVSLEAGEYPFQIHNYKDASWMPPRLALYVRSGNSYPKALHAFNSYPPDDEPTSPIIIQTSSEPKLLRAFLDFKGDRSKRLTHTIGVGDPAGVNYVYDMKAGNLVCVWRGAFVDATPMWHDRGDGSFKPLGGVQYLFTSPALALLGDSGDAFPENSSDADFRSKGYVIDEKTKRPIFKYLYKGAEIEDKIYPDDNDRVLTREINIKNSNNVQGLSFKLAEGSSIIAMPDGSYAVDDKQYYIKNSGSGNPTIRDSNGKKELVISAGTAIKYSVMW